MPADHLRRDLTGRAILSVAETQAAEQAVFDSGTSVEELMQLAGEGAAELIWRIGGTTPTLILCGPGNNGGDGYVIAEYLRQKGVDVQVAAMRLPSSAAAKWAAERYQGKTVPLDQATSRPQAVDALFGTGQDRDLSPEIVSAACPLLKAAHRRIAVDLPSGIDSDSGADRESMVHYHHCIALGAYKYAHFEGYGAHICGELSLVPLPITPPDMVPLTLAKPALPAPETDSHKYRRGMVVVVGGPMTGAAILAAQAAASSGAGYVLIAGQGQVPGQLPADIIWRDTRSDASLRELLEDPRIDTVVIGPGLGRDDNARQRLAIALDADAKLMIDADALYILEREALENVASRAVLTPHSGEFTALWRLLPSDEANDYLGKIKRTQLLADGLGCTIVQKGPLSVIAAPDNSPNVDVLGSNWLSVAGTGDVLSGAIAARLATARSTPFKAAQQGQWLHSHAARLLQPPFTASQLSHALTEAVHACLDEDSSQ
ncbi:NAD(P)H-hydrate dehydratase [Alterisphingorhabdus coralli]|uniref:ADP-dependent (S)-NAD(P)H-hydrate dehydratase n=1 Tax=Alterisphingorhabdus coralli TaxID=3071408 RepID=A0AA97F5S8_9SPHN|nr:NAD(P)H-hydrate dehydratase [Parasphingorhabdus sp. SCSIO 66989]WOE73971.1 NAD(P)H-hydrate dehydratase [Parasphingorhabdus sp. SCSIO 66989]